MGRATRAVCIHAPVQALLQRAPCAHGRPRGRSTGGSGAAQVATAQHRLQQHGLQQHRQAGRVQHRLQERAGSAEGGLHPEAGRQRQKGCQDHTGAMHSSAWMSSPTIRLRFRYALPRLYWSHAQQRLDE